MKVLFVGLGSVGLRHLNNLHDLGVNNFIAYRYRKNAPPGKLPEDVILKEFDTYQEALEQKPDVVVISNPSAYHLNYTMKAIEYGCNVYLEKPVSHDIDNVDNLLSLYNKKKISVQVGCQLRMHPHLIKIKEWLNGGKIGQVYSVSADVGEYLPDWHPWEDYRDTYTARSDMGGGVVLTLIHELDYLYWLFDDIEIISAVGGNLTKLEMDVEDTAVILMRSKKSIPIQLRMDYWRKPPVRRLNVVGEYGEINWDYNQKTLEISNRVDDSEIHHLDKDWDRNQLFIDLMEDFLMSIKKNCKVKSPLNDGVSVLKMANKVKKILNIGETNE